MEKVPFSFFLAFAANSSFIQQQVSRLGDVLNSSACAAADVSYIQLCHYVPASVCVSVCLCRPSCTFYSCRQTVDLHKLADRQLFCIRCCWLPCGPALAKKSLTVSWWYRTLSENTVETAASRPLFTRWAVTHVWIPFKCIWNANFGEKKNPKSNQFDSCFTFTSELANWRLCKQVVNRQTVNFMCRAATDKTYLMFCSAFTNKFDLNYLEEKEKHVFLWIHSIWLWQNNVTIFFLSSCCFRREIFLMPWQFLQESH